MPPTLPPAIRTLTALGEMRVWSVLITIFGDAIAPRGGVAPAAALQALVARLGIKPEATRVALHRLVKDEWIARQKSGRQSFYGLTDAGEAEFLTARKRIYAPAPALHDPWRLILVETPPAATDLIEIGPQVFLGHRGSDIPDDALSLSGTIDALPDWAMHRLAPNGLQRDYADLEQALIAATVQPIGAPEDAAGLRILIIHQWRRLLHRHADLPPAFFPAHWRGEACRTLVRDLHASLSETADPWLDDIVGAPLLASAS